MRVRSFFLEWFGGGWIVFDFGFGLEYKGDVLFLVGVGGVVFVVLFFVK